ncbi:Inosose dehydratase [Thalassoglobus neptunius]|uniref:Inosose dehydratase n=1 Tax=Thalassoglobus neptunius TaxID=1938619 RepID=A0A5C5X2M4_9PLAN|nr:sugar phosphate isomerase/epimerase family protein [Thalassoglobus neptunius]TWT57364.1 Inosose dehydratase [Thalassoglobus neptunius]
MSERKLTRRNLITSSAAGTLAVVGGASFDPAQAAEQKKQPSRTPRIATSTYSYWRYRPDTKLSIVDCIDLAAEAGFDGVEVLHVQMTDESNSALQEIKQRAFRNGLDLCGFSTHQSFVSPDPEKRKANVEKTKHQIELAYAMGIPTIRVNTGRWGTIGSFDDLMANKGIEPILDGYTEDEGFQWVIDSLEQCLKKAEECGVVLGLENHWGLGRTAEGVVRIIDAIQSPWLRATLDTGNFLERQYEQYEILAPYAVFVQAKTYYGGGTWYTIDIDYDRVAEILRSVDYHGYISLEFEGQEGHESAIPKSLDMLRKSFS